MALGRRRWLSIMDSARSSLLTILVSNRWRMIAIVGPICLPIPSFAAKDFPIDALRETDCMLE